MTENNTIGIEMPADEFFEVVKIGMGGEIVYEYQAMKDRNVEDVVITQDGRYRVVYGLKVAPVKDSPK